MRWRTTLRYDLVALGLVLLGWTLSAMPAAAAGPLRVAVPSEGAAEPPMRALLTESHEVYLESMPAAGEGLYAFARRLCGSADPASRISEANGGVRDLLAGFRYRVPFDDLTEPLQGRVVQALFGEDRKGTEGWVHRVRGQGSLNRGSLWHVARWFTGRGEHFTSLREKNGLEDVELADGAEIWIPAELLRPSLRAALPERSLGRLPGAEPAVAAPPEPVRVTAAPPGGRTSLSNEPAPPPASPSSSPSPTPSRVEPAATVTAETTGRPIGQQWNLEYGRDREGDYAVYRLRPGEALYSSVVVRFTGRILAVDVNALAEEIAERSGIADVTDIPVGYRVKIPLELLLPEFLPAGDPRRQEYERSLRETRQFTNQVRVADLDGVTVIIDPGHGGISAGATFGGVWESLYVYDIAVRLKTFLETHTSARVVVTTRDGDRHELVERDVLPFSRTHAVQTDPPYRIENSNVGVHLRWYLANSVYRRAVAEGADPRKVVFLSIHADSLHPSIRGAMVYVPGASLRQGNFRKAGHAYESRREWREQPAVSFSWQNRVESEGLSRDLAGEVIESFRRRELAIHPHKPVREKIIRKRSEFVPAVLRYNEVPAKLLVEVCNLANAEDRALLQTRAFRQTVAESLVDALLGYYGREPLGDPRQVAAR